MALDEQLLRSLDLNALVIFMVVYRERGVSRAADLLHITQPAVSNTLRKLRRHFGDALFIPKGGQVCPTALAVQIASILEPALSGLQGAIQVRSRTDRGLGGK
ncbi:helix-turn-helix domain-containing protein [Pseudomonas nitroreducens]|uniref:helix-turn-helix domain-containing protein n=1 Tax=Pseudomonas nitroreducens TaxID=46680 RepID=UPI002646A026|nr:LysR family transcriptional regulator [Pseudomonas nitroreducens]